MPDPHPALLAATEYVAQGYSVVPVPAGKKGPILPKWEALRLTVAELPPHFERGGNVGMHTGEPSGGLVDSDLDCEEARGVAAYFLPPTDLVCGRPGAPDSHWFYRCDPLPDNARYNDPTRPKDARGSLVELRSTGLQTIVPPSTHPSGEPVRWSRQGQPAPMHGDVLKQTVGKVAAAALLARHWPGEGSRHHTALALGGMLAHAGWAMADAEQLIEAAATVAGDDEVEDRVLAVSTSFEAATRGERVTGIPTLTELLDKRIVDAVVSWLGLHDQAMVRELERGIGAAVNGVAHDAAAPAASQGRVPRQLTDLGNGERFIDQHGHEARFSHRRNVWFTWTGTHWLLDEMGVAARMAAKTARSIWLEAGEAAQAEEQRKLGLWAKQSEAQGRREAMLRSAAADLAIDEAVLDADPWLLNCQNGILDLRSGGLLPHDPARYQSKLCAYAYQPDAPCPLWLAFLDRIMAGNQTLIQFLQRALGYSLTGKVIGDALFFLYGTGRNGKSTFLGTVQHILSNYAMQANSNLLLAKPYQQHPTELASLFGRRFVATIESGQGKQFDEQLVKQLTGGDAIRARRMREDEWEFRPTFKLWIAANHKPTIRGGDTGIWSRIKTVPFEVTIPEAERDPDLDTKLQAEGEGILAWMVRGCLEWQCAGLQEPEAVATATSDYREEMDRLAPFLADCCRLDRQAECTAAELYDAYQLWCVEVGEKATSQRGFGMRLEEHGFERVRIGHNGTRGYRGLVVRGKTSATTASIDAVPEEVSKQC